MRQKTLDMLTLDLQPTQRRLRIRCDDPFVIDYLRAAYGKLIGSDSRGSAAGTPRPEDHGALRRQDGVWRAYFNGEPLLCNIPTGTSDRVGEGAYLANQLVWRSLYKDEAWLTVYGSALRLGNRTILFVGPSNVGKTTLSLALMMAGAQLYADEFVCLRRADRLVSGLRRSLMVRRNCLRFVQWNVLTSVCLSGRVRNNAYASDAWYHVDAEALGGDAAWAAAAPLDAVFVLQRSAPGAPKIEALAAARAAADLLQYTDASKRSLDSLAELRCVLENVPAYRLSVGAVPVTRGLVSQTLRAC
jgi:hypothetical protein